MDTNTNSEFLGVFAYLFLLLLSWSKTTEVLIRQGGFFLSFLVELYGQIILAEAKDGKNI